VVVLDGVAGPEHDGLTSSGVMTFSPDGTRLAYAVKVGEKEAVVLDGKLGPVYTTIEDMTGGFLDSTTHVVFSADSKRAAWTASPAGRA